MPSLTSSIKEEIGLRTAYVFNVTSPWRPCIVAFVPKSILASHVGDVMSGFCGTNVMRTTMLDYRSKVIRFLTMKRRQNTFEIHTVVELHRSLPSNIPCETQQVQD